MINSIAPGMILILGSLLIPFLRGTVAKAVALALPVLSVIQMALFPKDMVIQAEIFDFTLTLTQVDNLSLVWGYIFHLAAFISVIYQSACERQYARCFGHHVCRCGDCSSVRGRFN